MHWEIHTMDLLRMFKSFFDWHDSYNYFVVILYLVTIVLHANNNCNEIRFIINVISEIDNYW